MPGNLHRAAMLDGAGPIRRFFSITLPWLKPTLLFIVIIATINALMAFDILLDHDARRTGQRDHDDLRLARLSSVLPVPELRRRAPRSSTCLTIVSLVLAILYFFVLGPRRAGRRAAPASPEVEAQSLPTVGVRRHAMATLPTYRPRRMLQTATAARLATAPAGACGDRSIFLWSALPVLALILMSLSPPVDLIRTPPTMFPSPHHLRQFRRGAVARGLRDQRPGQARAARRCSTASSSASSSPSSTSRSARSPATPSPAHRKAASSRSACGRCC